jgi:hypothetical protein
MSSIDQPTVSIPQVAVAKNVSGPDPYGRPVPDVVAAFKAVGERGMLRKYHGEPWVPNMIESHVQGIARYGDYLFVTHNNKGYSKGYIIIINHVTGKMVHKFDSPVEHFNHPGGCQTVGSYVAVALENSTYSKSYVCFYDLSQMTDSKEPRLLPIKLERRKQGAGGVGITSYTGKSGEPRYLMAVYDNGKLDLYKIAQSLEYPGISMGHLGQTSMQESDYSEICLVTQTDQKIFLVGFRTRDLGVANEDRADLYSVTWDTAPRTEPLESRHMHTEHGGVVGLAGVHFRYGAGLRVRSDLSLEFIATQRNFVGNEFYTNDFRKPGS